MALPISKNERGAKIVEAIGTLIAFLWIGAWVVLGVYYIIIEPIWKFLK